MRTYALRRVLLIVPTLVGLSLIAFALTHVAPGDPAREYVIRITDAPPTPASVDRVREELGLNRPLPVQYVDWLGDALTGDLGISYATRRPVTVEIGRRLRPTVELAVPAAVLSLVIAIPLGTFSGIRRNRVSDQMVRVGAIAGASLPNFYLALLLMGFIAVPLPLFPVAGRHGLASAILPVIVLATGPTAVLTRFTRSAILEVLDEDHVVAARARGLSRLAVLQWHVVRASLLGVLTAFGLSLAALLSGTVIVEGVFAWPGLGRLGLDAIKDRDFPMIQGFVVYSGLLFLVINLVIDLAYGIIDPRVRLGTAGSKAG